MQQIDTSQKVTVHVPVHLLKDAQRITGSGITQTITAGLEKLAASAAYHELLALKGVCRLEVDINALREDRGL